MKSNACIGYHTVPPLPPTIMYLLPITYTCITLLPFHLQIISTTLSPPCVYPPSSTISYVFPPRNKHSYPQSSSPFHSSHVSLPRSHAIHWGPASVLLQSPLHSSSGAKNTLLVGCSASSHLEAPLLLLLALTSWRPSSCIIISSSLAVRGLGPQGGEAPVQFTHIYG